MSDLSSAQTIHEGAMGINVPTEHQYKSDVASEVSYYQYRRLTPLSEPVLALNGTCISEFEITPSQVFNLSKSFLEADIVIPTAGANRSNVAHTGFCSYIDQIEYLDASGKQLVWIQNPQYYTKIVFPACTSQQDFLSNSLPTNATTVANTAGYKTTLINRSNVVGTAIDGGGVPTSLNADIVSGGVLEAYTGLQHGIVSGANTALAVRIQMPLSYFYGTLFACNKDLFFGQTTIIRITWNQGAKMGYTMATADGTAPASLATVPVLSNGRIRLAQQANPISAESIKKKVISEGLHLNVPFVWTYKYTLPTGADNTTQSFVRKINKGHGQRLLRVWTSQFNIAGDAGGAYYCQNQNFADAMYTQVWAQLDGVNLQENNLINNNGELYEFLQQKIDKSAGGSVNQFLSSPYMLNDWTPWKTIDFSQSDTEVCGLSLAEEREYAINFISKQVPTANGNNLFYMFVVCQRLLSITREGTMFA